MNFGQLCHEMRNKFSSWPISITLRILHFLEKEKGVTKPITIKDFTTTWSQHLPHLSSLSQSSLSLKASILWAENSERISVYYLGLQRESKSSTQMHPASLTLLVPCIPSTCPFLTVILWKQNRRHHPRQTPALHQEWTCKSLPILACLPIPHRDNLLNLFAFCSSLDLPKSPHFRNFAYSILSLLPPICFVFIFCVNTHVPQTACGSHRALRELVLSPAMWVLGIELRQSDMAGTVFTQWAISSHLFY